MNRGFTLIEILVSITILIVGILGVTHMVAQGMTYNIDMRHLLTARQVLERRMENFEVLPKADPWFVDPEHDSTNIDYDDLVTPDHSDFVIVDGVTYQRIWNVVWGRRGMEPDERFRTIRLHIQWVTADTHRINSDFIRWEER